MRLEVAVLTIALISCTNTSETSRDNLNQKLPSSINANSETNKGSNERHHVENQKASNPNRPSTDDSLTDADLIKKRTWGEQIFTPIENSISKPKFPAEWLLRTWTHDRDNIPVWTFQKDFLTVHGERNYIYTIESDSLRIFSSYDRAGDGIMRGILEKLTKDSLIIKWSTGDINKYVPYPFNN